MGLSICGILLRGDFSPRVIMKKAELTRIETAKVEALLESGRQRLEGLIDAAIGAGSTSGNPVGGEGTGGAGAELMRLWEEGKEQLVELAGKGGEVRCALCAVGGFSLTTVEVVRLSYVGYVANVTNDGRSCSSTQKVVAEPNRCLDVFVVAREPGSQHLDYCCDDRWLLCTRYLGMSLI